MSLTEEAKELLKQEFEAMSKQQAKTLQELEIYKWVLRMLFLVLFGGSILGILKFQDYLDSRVAARTEDLSATLFGVTLTSAGQASSALAAFDQAWTNFKTPLSKPSAEFRSFFFYYVVLALADAYDLNPDGTPVGKPLWDRLMADEDFRRDFPRNQARWRNNDSFLNAWARSILKYESSNETTEQARGYFVRAFELAEKNSAKAANLFAQAMLDIVEQRSEAAIGKLRQAESLSPRYKTNDATGNAESDLGDEYLMWKSLSKRLKNKDFSELYRSTIESMKSEQPRQ